MKRKKKRREKKRSAGVAPAENERLQQGGVLKLGAKRSEWREEDHGTIQVHKVPENRRIHM